MDLSPFSFQVFRRPTLPPATSGQQKPQIWFSPWRLSARISRAWNSGELASLYRCLPRRRREALTMRDARLRSRRFLRGLVDSGFGPSRHSRISCCFPRRDASVQWSTANYYRKEKARDWLSSRTPETKIQRAGVQSELTQSWNRLQATLNVNAASDWGGGDSRVGLAAAWSRGFSGCDNPLGQNPIRATLSL